MNSIKMNETKVRFCEHCSKKVNSELTRKSEDYNVKGQLITKDVNKYFCPTCGEDLTDDETENENLRIVYEEYKMKNYLLTSEEIKQIREKYGLSQKALAILLGWGEKTITRYEGGALQTKANNNTLKLIQNTNNFIEYWNSNNDKLSVEDIRKCEIKIEELKLQESIADSMEEYKMIENIRYNVYPKTKCTTVFVFNSSTPSEMKTKKNRRSSNVNSIINEYAFG